MLNSFLPRAIILSNTLPFDVQSSKSGRSFCKKNKEEKKKKRKQIENESTISEKIWLHTNEERLDKGTDKTRCKESKSKDDVDQ